MDLGVVGLEGLVGFSDLERKKNSYDGSGFFKQERSEKIITSSGGDEDELLWKGSKIAKIDDNNNNKDLLLLKSNNNSSSNNNDSTMFDGHQQQILSFSSILKSETSPNVSTLPCSYNTLSRNNNPGCYSYGAISIRGGFTPLQWMELEHQALIYKYITANVPVPSHLLIPIRKALDSAFFSFSNGLLRPNSLGWGAFHLGYSNSTDPEPGRCRRTDGKKWRCSRDAVVDQKYCERHMNRGRHRSRKPVEHALNNTNTNNNTNSSSNNNNNNSNNNNNGNKSSLSIVGIGNNGSNNIISFGGQNQEQKNMHNLQNSLASDASAANNINRVFMNNNNKQNNNATNPFMIHHHHGKHYQIQYEEESSSSRNNNNNNIEFGLVTSDSLLNPSQSNTTTTTTTTTTTLQNHSLRNFIDDCPKIQSSLFTSSPSQNNDEKLTLSPLRLSRELELDPIEMGLGVGVNFINESSSSNSNTRQGNSSNWNMVPISTNWESSMCGPLGEVLNVSNNNNNSNSPNSIGSSPNGVLKKISFGSVSNSSALSSPMAENSIKVVCNGNVSSSLPAM